MPVNNSANNLGTLSSITTTDSSDQNNYSPTDLDISDILRWNGTTSIKFTGLGTGAEGRVVTIYNATTDFLLWLENENTASSAANRFTLPNGFPAFLMPGDNITLWYTASRWVVLSWPNMGPAMGLSYFTDYIENVAGTQASVSGTGAAVNVGSYLADVTEKPAGISRLSTGTTTTGRASLGNTGTASFLHASFAMLSVARLAQEQANSGTETYQLISGFADSTQGTFTDGVAWNLRWNGSAQEWAQDRLSNTTATRSTTGSPTPDNTYIWLVVFVNPAGNRADFIYSTDSINFIRASSPTTGLPNNTRAGAWVAASMIKSAGTTSRSASVDLAGYRINFVRG